MRKDTQYLIEPQTGSSAGSHQGSRNQSVSQAQEDISLSPLLLPWLVTAFFLLICRFPILPYPQLFPLLCWFAHGSFVDSPKCLHLGSFPQMTLSALTLYQLNILVPATVNLLRYHLRISGFGWPRTALGNLQCPDQFNPSLVTGGVDDAVSA